jgi:hypothetical protein
MNDKLLHNLRFLNTQCKFLVSRAEKSRHFTSCEMTKDTILKVIYPVFLADVDASNFMQIYDDIHC